MAASKALVKPELLVWTRKRAKVRPEDAKIWIEGAG